MYDAISISTSLLFVVPIVLFILYHDRFYLVLGIGSLVASISAELIKKFITVDIDIFKRPKGARACDLLSRRGSAENQSGMPSAHASSTAFAATYILFTSNSQYVKVAAVLYWFSVCYSRYKKNCHTVGQLVAGSFLGIILAYLSIKII